jgi:pimeloyl-ACP methyl ester carboxylesterase
VGRGLSDWLVNPTFYALPQYVSDMVTLIARVQPKRLHWIGTSMGGLIGLVYAGAYAQLQMKNALPNPAQRHTSLPDSCFPLDSLLLNDVGPHIEPVSLARIGQYVGEAVSFDCFEDAVAYVQATCASFGPHTSDQWHDLTRHVYIEQSGRWIKHYDLAIASAFNQVSPEIAAHAETMLWAAFASLNIPIQIIRGQQSDLLSEQTCQKMLQTQPHAGLSQIQGVGHAPTLMDHDQISIVTDFFKNQRLATSCDSRC